MQLTRNAAGGSTSGLKIPTRYSENEREMSKFRDIKILQKFTSIHASIHNHFNLERHLTPRETFKQNRAAAMAEWRRDILMILIFGGWFELN